MKIWNGFGIVFFLLAAVACSSSEEESDSSAPDQPTNLSSQIGVSGITQNYDGSVESWRQLLDGANEVGAQRLHLQAPPWSEAETSPDSFDLSYFDPFLQLNDEYQFPYSVDLATPLGLGEVDLPIDLTFSSFAEPQLFERYKLYVEAVLSRLNGASYVILHTETAGPFFDNDPDRSDFREFCNFISTTANYIRAIRPGLKVGIYGTNNEQPEILRCLNRATDFFGVSYIADRGDAPHQEILSNLVAQAGDKPVALFEAGIPTAARIGGSESAQIDFVNLVFDLAAELGDNLLFFSYYQYFDENIEVTIQYVPVVFANFSPSQQEDAIAFFTSLGLRRVDGSAKPAWEVFRTRSNVPST